MNDATEPTAIEAVKALLCGAAPEKTSEIEGLFARYNPQFSIVGELKNKDHGSWVMEAGGYVHVRFNQRALRTFWLGCYVVWHGYSELAQAIDGERPFDPTGPREKLRYLREMLESEDSLAASWPEDVPEPYSFDRGQHSPEDAVPGELATIAVAWALFHEFRHLQVQQDDCSSTHEGREEKHAEEFECDRYAAAFLMDSIEQHCASSGDDEKAVTLKRGLGIMFGALVLGIMATDLSSATETHPPVFERYTRLRELLAIQRCSRVDTILSLAVSALNVVD